MVYSKPEEIHGYCGRCPNYNQFWSCPPHNHSVQDYLSRYNWAYMIGTKVYLNGLVGDLDPLEYYHKIKMDLNSWLISKEPTYPNSEVLISGHCQICQTCSRPANVKCSVPSKRRYSLESLGFKLSDLLNDCFGDGLQWKGSEVPQYLYIITGLLSASEVNSESLRYAGEIH